VQAAMGVETSLLQDAIDEDDNEREREQAEQIAKNCYSFFSTFFNIIQEESRPNQDKEDLLMQLIDKFIPKKLSIDEPDGEPRRTVLHYAIENHFYELAIDCIVKKGADVDVLDKNRALALHLLIQQFSVGLTDLTPSQRKLLTLLLEKGTIPEVEDRRGKAPLSYTTQESIIHYAMGILRAKTTAWGIQNEDNQLIDVPLLQRNPSRPPENESCFNCCICS